MIYSRKFDFSPRKIALIFDYEETFSTQYRILYKDNYKSIVFICLRIFEFFLPFKAFANFFDLKRLRIFQDYSLKMKLLVQMTQLNFTTRLNLWALVC